MERCGRSVERDGQGGQAPARRFDDHVDGASLADDALGPVNSDGRRRAAPGDPVSATCDDQKKDDKTGKPSKHLPIEPQNRLPERLTTMERGR